MAAKQSPPPCKLVAVDGNGTLLGGDGVSISELTRNIIMQVEAKGIPVVLATARPFEKAKATLEAAGMRHYVLTENGARAVRISDAFPMYELWLESHVTAKPLNRLKAALPGRCFLAQLTSDGGYIEENHPWLQDEAYRSDALRFFRNPVPDVVSILENGDKQCAKTYVTVPDSSNFSATMAEVLAAAGDGWEVRQIKQLFPGVTNTCEVQSCSVNKADGLRQLCEAIGISTEHVWAFGDDSNDIRMLREMGWGVRMANHQPSLDGVGDDVTKFSNEEDGVARYLQDHLLAYET